MPILPVSRLVPLTALAALLLAACSSDSGGEPAGGAGHGGSAAGQAGTGNAGTSAAGASGQAGTGSAGTSAAGTSGQAGTGSAGSGGAGLVELGQHVLTWYTFQDNTPSNSAMSASGRPLIPYVSVALPFRLLTPFGGTLDYGTRIYVDFLDGRTMPSGAKHDGWVQIDDFCGDNSDDSYCYQTVGGTSYPNIDLWIGDFTQSGMDPSSCSGPAGSGQELTTLYTGTPPASSPDYGGRSLGTGACGDSTAAQAQQSGCWYYTPPANTASYCADCSATTCAP